MSKTAVIFGASGLVGSHLLSQLLSGTHYARVIVMGRRPLGTTGPTRVTSSPVLLEHVIDFTMLASELWRILGTEVVDDVYYCMGTTIAKAKSRAAFWLVDYEYPQTIARFFQARGARKWLMISSVGASARSFFFYLRTKGELDEAIQAMGFTETHIFRPSFLLGERTEHRSLERALLPWVRKSSRWMVGPLRRLRGVEASAVAAAMVRAAQCDSTSGVHVHTEFGE